MNENPIPFAIAGECRSLTKEEIAAQYGPSATRPIPKSYRKPGVIARLNASLVNRFTVYRVHETNKAEFMSGHRTWEDADREAGRLRDAMTDEECASDFTYVARERKRDNGR